MTFPPPLDERNTRFTLAQVIKLVKLSLFLILWRTRNSMKPVPNQGSVNVNCRFCNQPPPESASNWYNICRILLSCLVHARRENVESVLCFQNCGLDIVRFNLFSNRTRRPDEEMFFFSFRSVNDAVFLFVSRHKRTKNTPTRCVIKTGDGQWRNEGRLFP